MNNCTVFLHDKRKLKIFKIQGLSQIGDQLQRLFNFIRKMCGFFTVCGLNNFMWGQKLSAITSGLLFSVGLFNSECVMENFSLKKKLFIHRQFLKFIFPKENSFFALLFRVGAKICPIPGNDFYDLRYIWRQDLYLYEHKNDEFFTTG